MSDTDHKEEPKPISTENSEAEPAPEPAPNSASETTSESTTDTEAPSGLESSELENLDDFSIKITAAPSLKELIQSSDAPSRYLIFLSLLFGFLGVACLSLLVLEYMKYRHAMQKPPVAQVETKLEPTITEPLGEFRVNFKDAELRVDLVAECSTQEACEQIKGRISEVRDLVIPLLQGSSREEILNPEKKLLLRRTIAEKLNTLKLDGKVSQIDMSDLTVEMAH